MKLSTNWSSEFNTAGNLLRTHTPLHMLVVALPEGMHLGRSGRNRAGLPGSRGAGALHDGGGGACCSLSDGHGRTQVQLLLLSSYRSRKGLSSLAVLCFHTQQHAREGDVRGVAVVVSAVLVRAYEVQGLGNQEVHWCLGRTSSATQGAMVPLAHQILAEMSRPQAAVAQPVGFYGHGVKVERKEDDRVCVARLHLPQGGG